MRVIFAAMAACLLASCGGGAGNAPQISRAVGIPQTFGDTDPHDWSGVTPSHYPVHGIDVSKYQGDVDWFRVRGSGVSFAFIKATEGGDHTDERFLRNWEGARVSGISRGAYHYFYFCRPALEQAAWFISHVPRDPWALPPVLDLEWTHKSRTCQYRPDPSTVQTEALAFLQAVGIYYRKRPIIYTTVDFYIENRLWEIRGYPFWLRSVAGHPSVTYPGQDWVFWQYSGTGIVSGIDGPTDLNVFAGTPAQLGSWTVAVQ